MWQSAALAGAFSLGGSVPTEFDTCWARLCPMWIPEAAAVIAAIAAPLMKVRRATIFFSRFILIQTSLHQLGERAEGAACDVGFFLAAIVRGRPIPSDRPKSEVCLPTADRSHRRLNNR